METKKLEDIRDKIKQLKFAATYSDINAKNYSDINSAVILDDVDAVKYFLSKGIRADKKREGGHENTPLHDAAFNKNFDMFKVLYESLPEEDRFAAINIENKSGVTPLLEAALEPEHFSEEMQKNMPELIDYIISHGGDITHKGYINGKDSEVGEKNFEETLRCQLNDKENCKAPDVLRKCLDQHEARKSREKMRYNPLNLQKLRRNQAKSPKGIL